MKGSEKEGSAEEVKRAEEAVRKAREREGKGDGVRACVMSA